jgi:crotonobetainyl-CoA:carnitine CoA-transferase CaiB-like acyl-CoA transferase
MDALNEVGVASGPINDFGAVAEDPQVRHRGVFTRIEGDGGPVIANPIRFSDTPARYLRPAPELGEHTEEVLRDWLGETA